MELTETLMALDELIGDIVKNRKDYNMEDYDSEIVNLAFSVTAVEPKDNNLLDRLDQSTECLQLAILILKEYDLPGFASLLDAQVMKNTLALHIAKSRPQE